MYFFPKHLFKKNKKKTPGFLVPYTFNYTLNIAAKYKQDQNKQECIETMIMFAILWSVKEIL